MAPYDVSFANAPNDKAMRRQSRKQHKHRCDRALACMHPLVPLGLWLGEFDQVAQSSATMQSEVLKQCNQPPDSF
jgi:hypothetical protein